MGLKGTNWRIERKSRKEQYINNLDETLKIYAADCIEDVDLDKTFEGQVRVLKLLTETGNFMMDLSRQMDEIQFDLEMINRKLSNKNKELMDKSVKITVQE